MGVERRLKLTEEYFTSVYNGKSTTALTTGEYYIAKNDPNGQLRVLNNTGKWSKYGAGNFIVASGIDSSVRHVNQNYVQGTSETKFVSTPTVPTVTSGFRGSSVPKPFVAGTPREIVDAVMKEYNDALNVVSVKEKTPMAKKKTTLTSFLNAQGVSDDLISKVKDFRKENEIPEDVEQSILDRIVKPSTWFVGKSWNVAVSAILAGKNILLVGEKATGKNVFAESLAYIFGRPLWDISCHTNTNAEALIGGETFRNGQVEFRPGSVYNVAKYGGFGVLDEINMAKADALAVLHSVTDRRRLLDVPGYERLYCNEATRFIGTMNSGYAGTKELNEAFCSRFVVIQVAPMNRDDVIKHLKQVFVNARENLKFFADLFLDLQKKAKNAEISTKAVDFRGILDAIELVELGSVTPYEAVTVGVANKVFDEYERNIVIDVINTLIPKTWKPEDIFPSPTTVFVDAEA